jgi:hypothetical protein
VKSFRLRPDQLDLDHLARVCESPGYALIQRKQEATLQQLLTQLETEREDVRFIQGQIAALRVTMNLPAILATELSRKEMRGRDT